MTSNKPVISNNTKQPVKAEPQDLKTRIQNILTQGSLAFSSNNYNTQISQSAKNREVSPPLKLDNGFDEEEEFNNKRPPKQQAGKKMNEIGQINPSNMKIEKQFIANARQTQSKEELQQIRTKQGQNMQHQVSPDRPPLSFQHQQVSQPQQQHADAQVLQRMLSEESQKDKNNLMLSYKMKDMQKVGFQENLNKKVNNQTKQTVGLLNKGQINSLTYHDSSSTKYNSYLVKSFWLLTSIKSKKMQDIVQNRQKTCQFCLAQGNQNSSEANQPSLQCHTSEQYRNLVRSSLDKKYLTSQDYYNSKIVGDIMYNENRHIVSVFKDYLIFDDFSEYLKRFYRDVEAFERLPKVFDFYEKYSKVFPNYVVLPENKYMFKNIERKQKLIDEKHQQQLEKADRLKKEEEEALAAGMGSSFVQRMKQSKNQIFGSQFLCNLTELDNTQSLLRQQSSKIIDMLAMQHNIPYGNQMMNDFIKQTNDIKNKEVLKFENLIQKLLHSDKHDDQIKGSIWSHEIGSNQMITVPELDLSMSSQAMSSFLHDFDLTKANNIHTLAVTDDSHFCADTPLNRSISSNEVQNSKKQLQSNSRTGLSKVSVNGPSREKVLVNIDLGNPDHGSQPSGPFIYQEKQKVHYVTSYASKGQPTIQQNTYQNSVTPQYAWSSMGDSKKYSVSNSKKSQTKKDNKISTNPQVNAITKALMQHPSQTPQIAKKKSSGLQQQAQQPQVQITNISPSSDQILGIAFKDRKLQDSMHQQQLSNSSLRSGQSQNQMIIQRASQASIVNSASNASVNGNNYAGALSSGARIQKHKKHTPIAQSQQLPTNLKSISLIKPDVRVNYRNTGSALDSIHINDHQLGGTVNKGSINGGGKVISTQQYNLVQNRSSLGNNPQQKQFYDSLSLASSKLGQSPMPSRQSPCIDLTSKQRLSQDNMAALLYKTKMEFQLAKEEANTQSFKSNLSNNVLSPGMASHSIKEAVNKLLPPQPQSQKLQKAKANRLESNTPTPSTGGLSSLTTTTALLNKFLDTQQQLQQQSSLNGSKTKNVQPIISVIGGNLKIEPSLGEDGINKVVYSTRGPQKKNFSSPNEELQGKKSSLGMKPKSIDFVIAGQTQFVKDPERIQKKTNNYLSNGTEIPANNQSQPIGQQHINQVSYEISASAQMFSKGPRKVQTETFVDQLSPSAFSRDLQSNHQNLSSKSVEAKERGGSEKIVDSKASSIAKKDLFIIPEMIYSVKGTPIGGSYSTKAELGRRVETSIGQAKNGSLSQQKQKRNPSVASENSANSQKSSYSTTSNPYQRPITVMTSNSSQAISNNSAPTKKKIKGTQLGVISSGGQSQGIDLKSTQLYEKIKNANTKKKQLATIFTFNK